MSRPITIKTMTDSRGNLSVIEDDLGFSIKRVYYIYGVSPHEKRGGHRNLKTRRGLICLGGSCKVFVDNKGKHLEYLLDSPTKCLILGPNDWHEVSEFGPNSTLLVLASEKYDPNDYVTSRIP